MDDMGLYLFFWFNTQQCHFLEDTLDANPTRAWKIEKDNKWLLAELITTYQIENLLYDNSFQIVSFINEDRKVLYCWTCAVTHLTQSSE